MLKKYAKNLDVAGDNGVWLNFEPKIRDVEQTKNEEILNPKKLYLEISGMTEMSGMTGKTGMPEIIKTDILSYRKEKSIKTFNNGSLGVIPVIPDKAEKDLDVPCIQPVLSDRDTQYYDDPVCSEIKIQITEKQLKSYIKKNPNSTTEQLLNKFGACVLKYKREGVF